MIELDQKEDCLKCLPWGEGGCGGGVEEVVDGGGVEVFFQFQQQPTTKEIQ